MWLTSVKRQRQAIRLFQVDLLKIECDLLLLDERSSVRTVKRHTSCNPVSSSQWYLSLLQLATGDLFQSNLVYRTDAVCVGVATMSMRQVGPALL